MVGYSGEVIDLLVFSLVLLFTAAMFIVTGILVDWVFSSKLDKWFGEVEQKSQD